MAEATTRSPHAPLQVSQLTRYIKYLIEGDEVLAAIAVEGEVCEFSRSSAGHLYFAIKDAGSQVSCVLFRREALRQADETTQLKKGVAVLVHGYLTLYEPRGAYQIYVERVAVQGDGAMFRRFERLKTALEAEGLFAPNRKRPLPPYPRTLALLTSPGSQAYHDVLHRLRAQYPFVRVIEAGVSVQGPSAADEIVMAIDIVNRLTNADIILLVRGGGAAEDLAAFNDERLARAIYGSRIPVVAGVGHETDVSIADLVADVRAATPSLAAAAAVPDIGALYREVMRYHDEIGRVVRTRVRHERSRWLDANRALLAASPQVQLANRRRHRAQLHRILTQSMHASMQSRRARLTALRARLDALDPLAVLGRGYAMVSDAESGRVVAHAADVVPGKALKVHVSDGEFRVRVEE